MLVSEGDEQVSRKENNVTKRPLIGIRFLALIGFSKEPKFAEGKPLVDYNVSVFQDALASVLAIT